MDERKLHEELQAHISTLEDFGKRIANVADLLKRTCTMGNGTHASAILAVTALTDITDSKSLRKLLAVVHSKLFADAKALLDSKYAADYEALHGRAPKRRKAG